MRLGKPTMVGSGAKPVVSCPGPSAIEPFLMRFIGTTTYALTQFIIAIERLSLLQKENDGHSQVDMAIPHKNACNCSPGQ